MLRRMLRAITGHKQPEVMIHQGRISRAMWERASTNFRERTRGDRSGNIQVLEGRLPNAITINKYCSQRLGHVPLEK